MTPGRWYGVCAGVNWGWSGSVRGKERCWCLDMCAVVKASHRWHDASVTGDAHPVQSAVSPQLLFFCYLSSLSLPRCLSHLIQAFKVLKWVFVLFRWLYSQCCGHNSQCPGSTSGGQIDTYHWQAYLFLGDLICQSTILWKLCVIYALKCIVIWSNRHRSEKLIQKLQFCPHLPVCVYVQCLYVYVCT